MGHNYNILYYSKYQAMIINDICQEMYSRECPMHLLNYRRTVVGFKRTPVERAS